MRGIQGRKTVWIDVAACVLLLSILAAHVIRDPSPWTEPFYSAARFDGQAGVAGLFVQAAQDRRVDHLLWPGLPMVAMGGWIIDATNLDHALDDGVAPKPEFYQTLDAVSRAGNVLGLLGVALLVLATYFLLLRFYQSRFLALVLAAYLAASQSAITQLGWVRSEVWSITFFAFALLVIAKPAGQSFSRKPASEPTPAVWALAGFLMGSALLSRINILFAVLGAAALIVWIALGARGAPEPPRVTTKTFLLAAIPLLLLPWYAFAYPGTAFWQSVSHYDRVTATALPEFRWSLSIGAIVLLSALPLILAALGWFLQGRTGRPRQWAAPLDLASRVGSGLLTGGILALLLWCAALGGPFIMHTRHVLATMVSTLNGVGPYLKAPPTVSDALSYIWDAGQTLGRPNAADLAGFLGLDQSALELLNPTTIAMAFGLAAFLLGVVTFRQNRSGPGLALLAAAWIGLMMLTEYLAATRGEFLDFRYYAFTQWYAIMAVGASIAVIRMSVPSPAFRKFAAVAASVFAAVLVVHAAAGDLRTASQKALFGRQIDVAGKTAPSLFEAFSLEPQAADWREQLPLWTEIRIDGPISSHAVSPPEAAEHFTMLRKESGAVMLRSLSGREGGRLILRVPVDDLNVSADGCLVVLRADLLLEEGIKSGLPTMGLRVQSSNEDRPELHWASVSSHWSPWKGWVTHAASASTDNPETEYSLILSWQPRTKGEAIRLDNIAAGVEPLAPTRLNQK